MTPYILGVDLSTKRVDVAAVPLYDEPRLGQTIHLTYADLPKIKTGEHVDPAERAIRARHAMGLCLITLNARGLEIEYAAVEHPAGRHVHPILLATFGAVCSRLYEYPTASYKPAEWRRLIGCTGRAVNEKRGGSDRVRELVAHQHDSWLFGLSDYTADALDAVGIALAHRQSILKLEAAA